MSTFPSTPEEFYALRDDRTNRCVTSGDYQRIGCAVYLASNQAATADGQTMLLVAANLLSRWCRRVTIALPSTVAHPELGSGDLGRLVLAQMQDADPFGEFQVVDIESAALSDVALCIGGRPPRASSGTTVFISASGWLAGLSYQQPLVMPMSHQANRLGAVAAACLGVGQIFKIALGMRAELGLREGTFDLSRLEWSNEPSLGWPKSTDIGKVLMVGAGSVGSAVAYCARVAGLRGSIDILDRDTIKVENFNRSPIFGHATFGLTKASAVARFLGESKLWATPIEEWWKEFTERKGRLSVDYDVWLPLANEFNVRHAMQQWVPPLMIHASTGVNWGVNHGRHVPGRDDCLVDRFPAEVSAAQLACSTAQVSIANVPVDAALPFASVFAGVLITADLVRALLPDYPQAPNFALFDLYGPLDVILKSNRKPRLGCVCLDQGRAFHDRFNAATKYRSSFGF